MISINEFKLTKAVIMLIGEDLGMKKKEGEDSDDYVDRIIE